MTNSKLNSFFATFFLFLVIYITVTPSAYALANVDYLVLADDPVADATAAAESTDTQIWFIAGCLGGIIGVIIAAAVEPKPSATALLGKDAEYVAIYTDTYTQVAKKRQTRSAINGCIAGTLVTAVIYGIAIAAAVEAED